MIPKDDATTFAQNVDINTGTPTTSKLLLLVLKVCGPPIMIKDQEILLGQKRFTQPLRTSTWTSYIVGEDNADAVWQLRAVAATITQPLKPWSHFDVDKTHPCHNTVLYVLSSGATAIGLPSSPLGFSEEYA